jgi:predicted ATP-dependent Lon-type protease
MTVANVAEIWRAIKNFRQSDFLLHVITQRSIEMNKSAELKSLLTLSDGKFLDEMRESLASLPMLGERTIDPVLNENTVQEIRNAFSNIFDDESTV